MKCFSPVWNGHISVDCGRCYGCLQNRRTEWTFRLLEEQKDSLMSSFVTLTYDDDSLVYGNEPTLYKKDVQDYIKRVRKQNKYKMKYYFVGEYGSKGDRPHYHGIVFNGEKDILREKWEDKGIVHIGDVSQKSIHYVTKYVVNKRNNSREGRQDEFAIMSNGLGLGYIKRNANYHKENDVLHLTFVGGMKAKLFRYYKQKIWKNENEVKRLAEITADNIDSYYRDIARQEAENKRFFIELANKQYNRTRKMNKFNKSKTI